MEKQAVFLDKMEKVVSDYDGRGLVVTEIPYI